jgi:hypothetical protein
LAVLNRQAVDNRCCSRARQGHRHLNVERRRAERRPNGASASNV